MTLSKYEVVVLFDAANSQEAIDKLKEDVESLITSLSGKILDKDDIGYLDTLYKIGSSNNPYFYSLYVELDTNNVKELKRKLGIINAVVRYKIFKMKNKQKFLKFKEVEKELVNIDFTDLTKSWLFNEIK